MNEPKKLIEKSKNQLTKKSQLAKELSAQDLSAKSLSDGAADHYDSLSQFHHISYPLEPKLHELLMILEQPKNANLDERFEKLKALLNDSFAQELVYRLHLKETFALANKNFNNDLYEYIHHHPKLILHLLCGLFLADSIEYIANKLNLPYTEAVKLFRELHNQYNIDKLISRILDLYLENKHYKEKDEALEHAERLGLESAKVTKDTQEERRRRFLRKYGDLTDIKRQLLLT